VSVVSADITISGKLFHTFTILGAKENFLKHELNLERPPEGYRK